MLSPSISRDLKDSIVLDQSFIEDDEVPLKPNYLKECMNISKGKSSIYVLNWVEDEFIINWDKIEESTKKIMNDKQLQDALDKVRNTKRFYYKIKS